jgi:hypothetical protein
MLRALRPASEALVDKVNDRSYAAHPARARGLRPAAGARRRQVHRLGWAGGIAAGFALVFGLWSWHGAEMQHWSDVAASATTVPMPDRIFTSRDRIFASSADSGSGAPRRHGDELFRGNFSTGG